MEKSFLKFIRGGKVYEMNEAFNEARSKGARLYAVKVDGTFLDIGDRKSYKAATELYTKGMGDGVLAKRR